MGMSVDVVWPSVGRPARVGDGTLADKRLGGIGFGLFDEGAQGRDFADLFEEVDVAWFVAVDADALYGVSG